MKWIGKGKAWIYVNDDDSVIDRVVYESGMYQSMKYCRSYVSLSGMKKYIEEKHAIEVGKVMEYILEPEKNCSLSVLKFFTWSTVGVALVAIVLMFFTLFAHAENRAISDILGAYARQPTVIIVQLNNLYPNPPAYLPPVRGQVLEQADFGGARLHETQPINLFGDSDELP
jgi:hypothetical protein